MTEHTRVRFVVKQSGSYKPFIAIEPYNAKAPFLKKGILSLSLGEEISWEEAERLADKLDQLVTSIAYTIIPEWENNK